MSKISKRYINSARKIRQDYLDLQSGGLYTPEVIGKMLHQYLEITQKDSLKIKKGIETKKITNKESAENQLITVLDGLSKNMDAVEKHLETYNKQVSSLREREEQLYNQIKVKYPDLTDTDIISQITESINDLN